MQDDALYMRRALQLAALALGHTQSNPLVGAVLVHDGRILAEGYHRDFGGPHAEVDCLERVAPEDRALIPESTLYVNLEPCAHYGKTPPCALRIVQEKIRHVVIANRDPFPEVAGKGLTMLRQAGIEVTSGLLENEGRILNKRFFCAQEQKRPFIILKWAESADGYLAPTDRTRTQLSNGLSQRLVHRWRTEEQAILVGTNTALYDNPRLNARFYPGRQPVRILIDSQARVPHTHHLFDGTVETWVVAGARVTLPHTVRHLERSSGDLLWPLLFAEMLGAGIISLIVEGGVALLSDLIHQGLWDEARVFKTPMAIGAGIAAPRLEQGVLTQRSWVGTDSLEVWEKGSFEKSL